LAHLRIDRNAASVVPATHDDKPGPDYYKQQPEFAPPRFSVSRLASFQGAERADDIADMLWIEYRRPIGSRNHFMRGGIRIVDSHFSPLRAAGMPERNPYRCFSGPAVVTLKETTALARIDTMTCWL
jgi:hypothetical protein